jgi:hypothetical protein
MTAVGVVGVVGVVGSSRADLVFFLRSFVRRDATLATLARRSRDKTRYDSLRHETRYAR